MNKYLMVILATLGLSACSIKDQRYYQTHLKELQEVLKACPISEPKGLTCEQLQEINNQIMRLVYELQINPQAFGTKILELQWTITKQKTALKANAHDPELQKSLKQNQYDLAQYLAIVKWLESPEN